MLRFLSFIFVLLSLVFNPIKIEKKRILNPLDKIGIRDTLFIAMESTECGEWGGHKETILIFRKNEQKLNARILIDTVPCNDIIEKNGVGILNPEKRKIVIDKTILLKERDEKLFNNFIMNLKSLNLEESVIANFGEYFVVKNTNGALKFDFWNSMNSKNTNYNKLKKEIFGELK